MHDHDKSHADRSSRLGPPKFGLRTLLVVVTAFCSVFAAFSAAGPIIGSALVLASLAVLAHVAGNALGTHLRDKGGRRSADAAMLDEADVLPRKRPIDEDFAPRTELSRRTPLGWQWVIVTSLGSVSSAVMGGLLLARHYHASATLPTITFAGLAAGVLGGMFTFAVFSLFQVLLGAMWQAHWQGDRRR